MNRREFLRDTAITAMLAHVPLASAQAAATEIAFTFDDPTTDGGANLSWQELNQRILATLSASNLKSILFVCGKRADSSSGQQLIAAWDRAGHLIGNHSYSHLYFNVSTDADPDGFKKVTLAEFEADLLKNEPLIRDYHHFTRMFRYPFFKEGDTVEKRDGMRVFLQEHGYRIGRATIDASDWAIAARLQKRVDAQPHADLAGYRDFFLQHIWERAQFYDSLALRVVGRSVRHTVVLHHNALNALFLDDLITMFKKKGWKPVDAEYAYKDDVYDRQPKILPAGESLIWALAKENGKFEKELRYPGEDDVYENPHMDALHL
ncbi:MAG TPA: polysaccharide deacetylase family protein [Candidatus Sulfotelmatobacter sp.]|nr:polysaccharide deacetylase family protein [Candidatus Sulfotelmatobacter sp.]